MTTSPTAVQAGAGAGPGSGGRPRRWRLVPVVALRQAGFPFDLVETLAAPDVVEALAGVLAAEQVAVAAADELKAVLREAKVSVTGDVGSGLGMLRPLPPPVVERLDQALAPTGRALVARYGADVGRVEAAWAGFERRYFEHLRRAGAAVVSAFRDDDLLREVLLLSNDRQFPLFDDWLNDPAADPASSRGRKMVDLLTMYFQRVTTKNETHSHFGPISAGRVGAAPGITWTPGERERVVFFSFWAAERVAAAFSRHPDLRRSVRPRRRPWALARDGRVYLYEFTTETGYIWDWRFQRVGDAPLRPDAAWLLSTCDGETPVGTLAARFAAKVAAGELAATRDFDALLAEVVEAGWVVDRLEVPIGTPYPLPAIREQLPPPDGGASSWAHGVLSTLEGLLAELATAPHPRRAGVIEALKAEFEKVTGESPNRGGGKHYADRGVFFEECHSPLRDFEIGPAVADYITEDLSTVYDLVMAGPRLLVQRESAILRRWLVERFGADVPVPLDRFYEAYFADRPALERACQQVQAELDQLDAELTDLLLGGADGEAVVEVPRERIAAFVARYPVDPPVVCNPDVMIAATPEGLARGDFTAVIGDCHAVREVLSHTSFTPLIAQRVPELTAEMAAHYAGLLDDDELLCDMARSHPNKTGSQVMYPGPDIEIFGRSPKPRAQVIAPADLYLIVRDGRLELRAHGVPQRLRMQAPPAGGPSIMQDPLSPFAFPRHFGGIGLRASHRPHIPRIRFGRVVVCRQTWRVPAADLRGRTFGGNGGKGDPAEFFAARRLRQRLGLPRHVFAKIAGEPKPLFVDFDSPLLVRQLFRMARTTSGRIEFTEMLPGPDELWLRIDGRRYTSELRCAVFNIDQSRV